MTLYRVIPATLPLLAAALLVSCQAEPKKQPEAEADPHQGVELPPGHPAIAMPGDGGAVSDAAASASRPFISLDGEGLRLVDAKSGATRPLSFGADEKQLKLIAEKLKGPAKSGRSEECGAGPLRYLSWDDGLTLYSLEGLFAGWALDQSAPVAVPSKAFTKGEPSARLTTISGIGIGSTRAQLLNAYDATIEQTTLGTEFNAEGLSGILDGDGPKARVTNLWSGVNCVFR